MTVLELDPDSHAAIQSHIQILLSLDRYKDALAFITSHQSSEEESNTQWQLEQAYALYKLGRVPEAATIVEALRAENMQLDEDGDYARAVNVLDAQVVSNYSFLELHSETFGSRIRLSQKYRLENFDQAQVLYEDLLATVEAVSNIDPNNILWRLR